MFDVLLFAGTSEGRQIAEALQKYAVSVCVFTATEYGSSLIEETDWLQVRNGRLDADAMEVVFRNESKEKALVIDATHPYAVEVSANIQKACEKTGREYLRVQREIEENTAFEKEGLDNKQQADGNKSAQISGGEAAVYVSSASEAAAYLNSTEGNIFLTTGSKELKAFQAVQDYQERIYARVLSIGKVVTACEELGFRGKHLLCMQGPFSKELNIAMLREYKIRYLVTKDTGRAGGFPEKAAAARACACQLVIIQRPEEKKGLSMAECASLLAERFQKKCRKQETQKPMSDEQMPANSSIEELSFAQDEADDPKEKKALCRKEKASLQREISLVGIGMNGSHAGMTQEGIEICREADILIGAKRIAASVKNLAKNVFEEYRPAEILDFLQSHQEYRKIALLMSGDTGFFSGSKKLLQALENEGIAADVYPGLSSLSYFCSRINQSWDDADICSLHGRKCNLVGHILQKEKVFTILGKKNHVAEICEKLCSYEMNDLKIYVGENLGLPNERILCGSPASFLTLENDTLAVMMVINASANNRAGHRIPDEFFLRDKVPMTKEEIRTISVAKLDIRRGDTLYDVGAGSGSVTMEMAAASLDGQVFAIEKKERALELLEKNRKKCCADNVVIVPGEASEVMSDLPAPDAVFIGGSSGNMAEIIAQLQKKNPKVRIVINAITLETIAQTMQLLKNAGYSNPDIVAVNIAKAKALGDYHLMMAQNPVYIITAGGISELNGVEKI